VLVFVCVCVSVSGFCTRTVVVVSLIVHWFGFAHYRRHRVSPGRRRPDPSEVYQVLEWYYTTTTQLQQLYNNITLWYASIRIFTTRFSGRPEKPTGDDRFSWVWLHASVMQKQYRRYNGYYCSWYNTAGIIQLCTGRPVLFVV